MGFVLNPFTGQLDFVGAGGGGPPVTQTPNYQKIFNNTSDWSGPSGGQYTQVILATTHSKGTRPLVQVWELVGSDYVIVSMGIVINTSGDITLEVSDVPDNRFAGKILIAENN